MYFFIVSVIHPLHVLYPIGYGSYSAYSPYSPSRYYGLGLHNSAYYVHSHGHVLFEIAHQIAWDDVPAIHSSSELHQCYAMLWLLSS